MAETSVVESPSYICSREESDLLQQISLPLNHCNVPSWLLASTAYQVNPIPIEIDGIHVWYPALFKALNSADSYETRSEHFKNFMTLHFRLGKRDLSVNFSTRMPVLVLAIIHRTSSYSMTQRDVDWVGS